MIRGRIENIMSISIMVRILAIFLLLSAYSLQLPGNINAEVIERIVAIVNDDVILQSEFEEFYRTNINDGFKTTEDEAINLMVNRMLIIQQAKKIRMSRAVKDASDEEIINEYKEKRVKNLVHIPFDEIESYYNNNKVEFGSRGFYEVKNEIEELLAEKSFEQKLAEHLEELRKNAYIRIQLEDTD